MTRRRSLLTNSTGDILEQYDYDAFGLPYFYDPPGNSTASSPFGNRFLFTGREWLSDLRIYDFRRRHYQPELGRFLQPDPIQFTAGDYNLYRYCHNDPVNKSDPLGEAATFMFTYGTVKKTESGTEFAKIAASAEKGSLDAVIIKGHGTSNYQSFNGSGPASKSDSAIVRTFDGKAQVIDPTNKSNGGVVGEVGALLAGKFHDQGGARIGMTGCDTANATENVVRSVSRAVPGVTVYGPSMPMTNPFWSGLVLPYPYSIPSPERIYRSGEPQ